MNTANEIFKKKDLNSKLMETQLVITSKARLSIASNTQICHVFFSLRKVLGWVFFSFFIRFKTLIPLEEFLQVEVRHLNDVIENAKLNLKSFCNSLCVDDIKISLFIEVPLLSTTNCQLTFPRMNFFYFNLFSLMLQSHITKWQPALVLAAAV